MNTFTQRADSTAALAIMVAVAGFMEAVAATGVAEVVATGVAEVVATDDRG
jgi:hypothetical protein